MRSVFLEGNFLIFGKYFYKVQLISQYVIKEIWIVI